MAKRLEFVLSCLINTNQTGYISQRQAHDNIRHTLHILSHIQEIKYMQRWSALILKKLLTLSSGVF